MRTVKVCSGIGDNIWVLRKLVNTGEKFNFVLPANRPLRGHQLFELLPSLTAGADYSESVTWPQIYKDDKGLNGGRWADIKDDVFSLSANLHLEAGHRLEQYLPDLPLSRGLPLVINSGDKLDAEQDLLLHPGSLIGIYGSAYSTARNWKEYGAWGIAEWLELICSIHIERPKARFVLIGAKWDLDLTGELAVQLRSLRIPYFNTVGKSLGYVAQIMQRLQYALYFPSGLPILSEALPAPGDCLMFYGSNLDKMRGSWADPARLKSKQFTEMLFTKPADVFAYLRNDYKLLDRI